MTHYPSGVFESKQCEVCDRKHIEVKQKALTAYYKGKNPIDILRNNRYSYYYAGKKYTACAIAAKLLSTGNQAFLFTKAKPGTIGGLFDRMIRQVALMDLQRRTPNKPQPARENLSKLLESTALVYGLEGYTVNGWHSRFVFFALTGIYGDINANIDTVTSSVEILFSYYLNNRKPWFMYLPDETVAIAINNELKKLSVVCCEFKEAQYPMPDTGLIQRNKDDFFLWQKSKENFTQGTIQRMEQRISIIDDFIAAHFTNSPMIFSVTQTEILCQLKNLLLSNIEFKVMNANNSNFFLEAFDQYIKFIHYKTKNSKTKIMLSLDRNMCQEDIDDKQKAINVIAKRFRNGVRKASNIDFERFKNYYADEYDKQFEYGFDWFNNLLAAEALIYDDRAYIYSDEVVVSFRLYLEQMGSPCIFIDTCFERFASNLYTFSIFSVEMLRAFIEKYYPDISVKWAYILLQENVSPSDLIKEVFSERETWSIDELQERLPCLKMDTIRQTMNTAEYFRVEKGTYTHIDNINLPNCEGDKIRTFVESKLRERDYVTANELDLSKFVDLNPHCSFAAVRDAVFHKFLSDCYNKSGQVITRSGGKLRVLDIIEQYCREANAVTFDELNAFEATFDPEGRTHSQCLIGGHNTMVRVSSELFVSAANLDFDVAKIDEAIALYCNGNFIPLRNVADFSLFPFAGYPWNLFLLESYLRRFSRTFKYDVRAVNSTNIGAIVRKSFAYNEYDDILSLALAMSSVQLSDRKAVGNYLFENGYIGWRNLGKSEEKIIKNAKKLREEGVV